MEIISNLEEPIKKLLNNREKQEKHTLDLSKKFLIYRNGGQELAFAFDCYLYNKECIRRDSISTGAGIFFKDRSSKKIIV